MSNVLNRPLSDPPGDCGGAASGSLQSPVGVKHKHLGYKVEM